MSNITAGGYEMSNDYTQDNAHDHAPLVPLTPPFADPSAQVSPYYGAGASYGVPQAGYDQRPFAQPIIHQPGSYAPIADSPYGMSQFGQMSYPQQGPVSFVGSVTHNGRQVPVAVHIGGRPRQAKNAMGTAGFVVGLIGLLMPLLLGLVMGIIGTVFSGIGLSRPAPKGLAVAGLILSILAILIII